MTRLDHWIACAIGERSDPAQLYGYAVCHVIRRLRGRPGGTYAARG